MDSSDREALEKFHFKKVTQSEYRGGRSNVNESEKYLDCTLKKLALKSDADKDKIRKAMLSEYDHILSVLLPEKLHDEVKKSALISDVFKRLDL